MIEAPHEHDSVTDSVSAGSCTARATQYRCTKADCCSNITHSANYMMRSYAGARARLCLSISR